MRKLLGWWRRWRHHAQHAPSPPFGRPWGGLPFDQAIEAWKTRLLKRWRETDECQVLMPEGLEQDLILEPNAKGQWVDVMLVLSGEGGEILHEQIVFSIERSSGDVWNVSLGKRWGSIYGGP